MLVSEWWNSFTETPYMALSSAWRQTSIARIRSFTNETPQKNQQKVGEGIFIKEYVCLHTAGFAGVAFQVCTTDATIYIKLLSS